MEDLHMVELKYSSKVRGVPFVMTSGTSTMLMFSVDSLGTAKAHPVHQRGQGEELELTLYVDNNKKKLCSFYNY